MTVIFQLSGRRLSLSRRTYFEIWCSTSKDKKTDVLFKYIFEKINVRDANDNIINNLKSRIRLFSRQIEQKWKSGGCRKER